MEKASISEIKNRLSAYLKKVRAGQSILILDRDQPVARLERVEGADHPDDRLTRLERAGLVRRSTRPVPTALLRKAAPKARQSVLAALLEERKETR
jgi:antitoxin (DNA-binding transcriptional repressor) of toxin-antitoxin stability system